MYVDSACNVLHLIALLTEANWLFATWEANDEGVKHLHLVFQQDGRINTARKKLQHLPDWTDAVLSTVKLQRTQSFTNLYCYILESHTFSQVLHHLSTNFLVSVHKTRPEHQSFNVIVAQCACYTAVTESVKCSTFRNIATYDRESVVLASRCLAVQFLLVRMTVSIV